MIANVFSLPTYPMKNSCPYNFLGKPKEANFPLLIFVSIENLNFYLFFNDFNF